MRRRIVGPPQLLHKVMLWLVEKDCLSSLSPLNKFLDCFQMSVVDFFSIAHLRKYIFKVLKIYIHNSLKLARSKYIFNLKAN